MKVRNEVVKWSSVAVLRKMVKNVGLSEVNYPINTNPSKPVLLISDHLDVDPTSVLEKSAERQLADLNLLRRLKTAILLKTKEDGPHIRLRHQHVQDPDGKIVSL